MEQYDVLIIGAGPGGQKAAIQAGKLKKKVAIIEDHIRPGGFCTHTGTIPSKTLKFAADFFHALNQNVQNPEANETFLATTFERALSTSVREEDIADQQLTRNGVELIQGSAKFIEPHKLEVTNQGLRLQYTAPIIVIATGSRPRHSNNVPFSLNGPVYDSDTILSLEKLPHNMVIEGGGVIGSEYACIFNSLGVKVTLVNSHPTILNFLDHDIRETLESLMKKRGINMLMNTRIRDYSIDERGVCFAFEDGGDVCAESALICSGRIANIDNLGLENTKITVTDKKTIEVDENFQTSEPGVYAIGDVIGFPSLAAAAMVHGRRAMRHALKIGEATSEPAVIPMGIWTVPEASAVGLTEKQLQDKGIPYKVGRATFRELARAQIDDNRDGLLKILFCPDTLKIHGVHIIGKGACDLIHLGQAVMTLGGTIEVLAEHPANFPTYTGAYKVAAINGLNQ